MQCIFSFIVLFSIGYKIYIVVCLLVLQLQYWKTYFFHVRHFRNLLQEILLWLTWLIKLFLLNCYLKHIADIHKTIIVVSKNDTSFLLFSKPLHSIDIQIWRPYIRYIFDSHCILVTLDRGINLDELICPFHVEFHVKIQTFLVEVDINNLHNYRSH